MSPFLTRKVLVSMLRADKKHKPQIGDYVHALLCAEFELHACTERTNGTIGGFDTTSGHISSTFPAVTPFQFSF